MGFIPLLLILLKNSITPYKLSSQIAQLVILCSFKNSIKASTLIVLFSKLYSVTIFNGTNIISPHYEYYSRNTIIKEDFILS